MLASAVLVAALFSQPVSGDGAAEKTGRPNFVVIFADDLGYGDLACFGHPTIATPNLDRMAAEGTKLTQCYVAASVCTPSRAGLMTGRLPIRNGMCGKRRVLFPDSAKGLPQSEVTVARLLKRAGYATGMFGKWHLGHLPEYLPTSHGFDAYFGIPYSNDMDKVPALTKGKRREIFWEPKSEYFNVPIVSSTRAADGTTAAHEEVERPAHQPTLTKRYTEKAVAFIKEHKAEPFFVYLPHSLPHVPLFRSEAFEGRSLRGLYGDVIEEIDWSVGQVLDTLRDEGLAENTVVLFTSDNGPWHVFGLHGGSAGPLRGAKGMTWEGGMRVPAVAWGKGVAEGRVARGVFSTLDVLPTFAAMAGVEPPDTKLDGVDQTAFLAGGESARDSMAFYRNDELYAWRMGPWKAHLITQGSYDKESGGRVDHDEKPLLFNLEHDPSERHDVAADHPEVIEQILVDVQSHIMTLSDRLESQLEARITDAGQK